MSLANVRKHWRFLAVVLLIFMLVAAAGPLLFYGLGPLVSAIIDRFGSRSMPIMAMIFGVFTLGWLFFVLWAGDKADRLTMDRTTDGGDAHG